MSKRSFLLVGSIIVVIAIALGGTFWRGGPIKSQQASSPTASVKIFKSSVPIGGAWTLVDHNGKTRSDKEFRGKYLWIYFGYTFCPDICPMALTNMSEALGKLGPAAPHIQPIFITIDPERDTPSHLRLYMKNFPATFLAMTGSPQQLAHIYKKYHVYAAKVDDSASTDYIMDHTSLIYVMDRQGKYVTSFSHTTPAEEIVTVMQSVMK